MLQCMNISNIFILMLKITENPQRCSNLCLNNFSSLNPTHALTTTLQAKPDHLSTVHKMILNRD